MESSKTKVVVVGGGVAGALVAKELQFVADVVLVDQKEYFEIPWANLRCMVEPPFAERSIFKHTDYLTNGRLVVSTATNVTDTEVLTSNGDVLPYDYLVIATGHSGSFPKDTRERLQQFQRDYEKINSSHSILIIGGGPTGVELAGEIAVDFPEKKVILIHRGSRLLEFIGPKASTKALDWLTSRKVQVLLDQSIDFNSISESATEFRTSTGKTISADCHYICIGKPIGSSWLHESILKDCLDRNGQLMVDDKMRVKGKENIFAIGDITDIREIKQGYLAQKHAHVVAKNLKVLLGVNRNKNLSSYNPTSSPIAIVSLGRKNAIAQFPFTTIGGCVPGLIKSRDLFVGKTRKEMGLDAK